MKPRIDPTARSGPKGVRGGLVFVLALAIGSAAQALPRGQAAQNPFSWSQFQVGSPPPADSQTLALGKRIFLANCSGCHGQNGDGKGWWAMHLYPKPRNFTRGVFRYKETETGELPRDQDLFRTVSVGVQGTAMPAWQFALSEAERWALVAYIKTFSPYFAEEQPGEPVALGARPAATEERVRRGKELFAKVGCAECHGPEGDGNGRAAEGMKDSFGYPIRPRNFHRAGEFKRGRTIADVALTIATGNDGTPMPSFWRALTRDQIWNLASFVVSLEVEPEPSGAPMGPMRGCLRTGGVLLGGPMKGGAAMPERAGRGMGSSRMGGRMMSTMNQGCPMTQPGSPTEAPAP